jgi:hypothetical protein
MGQPILARARELFGRHRKRIATLVLFVGLAIVGVKSEGVPRDTSVAVPLGDDHAQVTEARIDYLSERRIAHTVTLRWPEGAPSLVRHDVELLPGDYDVHVRLNERDGTQRDLEGHVHSPSEGVVRLALEEDR